MSDGISDGHRAEDDHRAKAKELFGKLTLAELYKRSEIASAQRKTLRAAKALIEKDLAAVELECDQLFTVILELSRHQ